MEREGFKLDDLTLETKAQSYPKEMHDDFMWLGWYVREVCSRNLDTLVTRLEPLGVRHDKTTWSKILRGFWNHNADGKLLEVPILALPKFQRAVELLRKDQRLSEASGKLPFVETTTTKTIFNFIDARRAPDRINKFGVITGKTGLQKTASYKEYSRQHNHGLVTWQEAPANGSIKQFVITLAMRYGGGSQDSYTGALSRVIRTVRGRHCIIIDNAQTLYREGKGADQPVFNLLRGLVDEKDCTIILSITDEFHRKLTDQMRAGYFEQFEGRAGGRRNFLYLPEYPPDEDVLAFAQAFKLKDAEKHVDYLSKIAREPGRVRLLLEYLQEAKVMAEAEKRPLTISMIKELREEES